MSTVRGPGRGREWEDKRVRVSMCRVKKKSQSDKQKDYGKREWAREKKVQVRKNAKGSATN